MYSVSAYGASMKTLTIEINTKEDLQPVKVAQLKSSTYSVLKTLQILTDSSQNKCECDVSCGAIEWDKTPEEINFVEQSAIWSYLTSMWAFAEGGELVRFSEHLDDAVGDLIKWLSAVEPISDYSGGNAHTPILKIIIKFFARIKLEFGIDLSEGGDVGLFPELSSGCIAINAGWLPQVGDKHLTIVEMALLAGVSNIRTVRNAQYDKENPLKFLKEGKKVQVETDIARAWLVKRRGYVATNLVL
jgi:hypothetical protein